MKNNDLKMLKKKLNQATISASLEQRVPQLVSQVHTGHLGPEHVPLGARPEGGVPGHRSCN